MKAAPGLRWERKPPQDHEHGGPSYCLTNSDRRELIRIRPVVSSTSRKVLGWWWYGLGKNTAHRLIPTLDDAMAEALDYVIERRLRG